MLNKQWQSTLFTSKITNVSQPTNEQTHEEHKNDITGTRFREGAYGLGHSISHGIPSSFLLKDRRGYQRDTAPEPLGGERTITIMTDLQNNFVHRSIIVIHPLTVRTANQDTLNSFNNRSKGISNFATDSQVNRSHWLTL